MLSSLLLPPHSYPYFLSFFLPFLHSLPSAIPSHLPPIPPSLHSFSRVTMGRTIYTLVFICLLSLLEPSPRFFFFFSSQAYERECWMVEPAQLEWTWEKSHRFCICKSRSLTTDYSLPQTFLSGTITTSFMSIYSLVKA